MRNYLKDLLKPRQADGITFLLFALFLIAFIIFWLYGCAVCRHEVGTDLFYCVEKQGKNNCRIVIYPIYDIGYSHHAQVQAYVNGEWLWWDSLYGLQLGPLNLPNIQKKQGTQIIFTPPEYLDWLSKH